MICVSAAADDETAKNCPVMAMGREDFPCGAFAASWLVACEVHETQVRQNWKDAWWLMGEKEKFTQDVLVLSRPYLGDLSAL